MHVPNAQPPQPVDWEPRATHPVHHVPYQIAAAWDLRVRADVEAKKSAAALRKQQQTKTLGDDAVAGRVPRELFVRAKKTPAVKTWVRSLEEPVRKFLVDQRRAREDADAEIEDSSDSTEDEEIVFVGRNGTMRDGWKKARREDKKQGATEEGMVFDALGDDDESSAFKYVQSPTSLLQQLEIIGKEILQEKGGKGGFMWTFGSEFTPLAIIPTPPAPIY